jgi:hypothetical protein
MVLNRRRTRWFAAPVPQRGLFPDCDRHHRGGIAGEEPLELRLLDSRPSHSRERPDELDLLGPRMATEPATVQIRAGVK